MHQMNANREVLERGMAQCAIDFNCEAADFRQNQHVFVTPINREGRRFLIPGLLFFRMITFGANAVIAADERIRPWLESFVQGNTGPELFEEPQQREIDAKLAPYGKPLWSSMHVFLPDLTAKPTPKLAEVRWFEEAEIEALYTDKRFSNALQYRVKPERPDVLIVAAYEQGQITGMAGASADSKDMWQIGIDVLPEHRHKGIAWQLVALLKDEILRRGFLPYYSTSQSNIFSQNVARKAGFFPAWAETCSTEEIESD